MKSIRDSLKQSFSGDILADDKTLNSLARDTSLFERTPSLAVYPKNAKDVSALVKEIALRKSQGEEVSVTARSAGTCMSGGSLTNSVVAVFTKYMNEVSVGDGVAVAEPGVFYRDFEKQTLKKGLLLPSYPASRSIAAIGGIVANNSGGERSLEYGKTEHYVEEMDVVLSDGTNVHFKELTRSELEDKKTLKTLEGAIYRDMDELLTANKELVLKAKPHVSKNSAGYALWNARDYTRDTTNLAKLMCGAQGTLALMTKVKLSLVHPKPYRSMLVIFAKDFSHLPAIVKDVLQHNPESFESYDEHTMKLAVRLLPQMLMQMGLLRAIRLGFAFIPEVFMALTGGVPKLVLMAEFARGTQAEALQAAKAAQGSLGAEHVSNHIMKTSKDAEKYWVVRRESFALLRKNLSGLYAAPFIDDFVVPPSSYPEFLPRLSKLLDEYKLIYTIAGHIGNGNFHIIPLMKLTDPKTREIILELSHKVYDLVLEFGGTTTGEHNDGIIRTPYLEQMYGKEVVALFAKTKSIFDPLNIFNPGKKVGGTFADIEKYLRRN
jgi:FAD/FMN-containing dehydrogenase